MRKRGFRALRQGMVALHAAPTSLTRKPISIFRSGSGEPSDRTNGKPGRTGRAFPGGLRSPSESIELVTSRHDNAHRPADRFHRPQKKGGWHCPPKDCWGLASVKTPRVSHTSGPQARNSCSLATVNIDPCVTVFFALLRFCAFFVVRIHGFEVRVLLGCQEDRNSEERGGRHRLTAAAPRMPLQ